MAKRIYVDDDRQSTLILFKLRAPALLIGLFLGIGISFFTSSFEEVLSSNIRVAFFLPFIVYIADAIGTQTEAIYSRDLKSGKTKFHNYLIKELTLGFLFGLIFSLISGPIIWLWFEDKALALSVSIASFLVILSAPLVALLTAQIFYSLKEDPAADTGPIATVIQDMLSVIIYCTVASLIIL